MRIIPAVLFLVAAGISTASAQASPESAQGQGASAPVQGQESPAPAPAQGPPPFSMDHGQAADAEAAAKAEAAAAEARTAAVAAGVPLSPSESTDFSINGADVVRLAPPPTSEQQKADAQARDAWQARCRPTVIADREGLRRTQYAERDCDLSRFNTAGAK